MPANIVVAIIGGIAITGLIAIIACAVIDHGNFVNLDGGD